MNHARSRNKRRRLRAEQGFTLVEIMIVVAIIAMLAVIAVPGFAKARVNASRTSCLNNLRQLDNAKQEWGLESHGSPDALPLNEDLVPYLRGRTFPTCPGYGFYRIRSLAQVPLCNQPGHELEPGANLSE